MTTQTKYTVPNIESIDQLELKAQLQHKIDNKTKPLGSLGQLETLALRIGQVLGSDSPELKQPQLMVFAADHGLAARGVSAYPSDVTWQMVQNFLAGGAAVSVLARQHNIGLTVVDCGVAHDFEPQPGLVINKVALGAADSLVGPAMSAEQCSLSMSSGAALVKGLPGNALLLGEMGIGNTSAAAMLMARLGSFSISDCTGAGTGLDSEAVQRKIEILRQVLNLHADAREPLEALTAFGGFEIAAMAGAVLQAAVERRVIVVDGFIATAAVLVASKLQPHVLQRCVFAHRSGERGHALLLSHLKVEPLLDMGMRLGEGSGAALAWPLLLSACALMRDMASFEGAGVSRSDNENQSQSELAKGATTA